VVDWRHGYSRSDCLPVCPPGRDARCARTTDVGGDRSPGAGPRRRPGGGRTPLEAHDPTRRAARERLVEPTTRGDPASPWRWTSKRVRRLAAELGRPGHPVSQQQVAEGLRALGDRWPANRPTRAGSPHPDRAAQFAQITAPAAACLAAGDPVRSVDTQQPERGGDGKNGGRAGRPKGPPAPVPVQACPPPELGRGRGSPAGGDDLAATAGGDSGGLDPAPAAWAGATSRRWWERTGRLRAPHAQRVRLTAEGGGRTGSRWRRWTGEVPPLAEATGRESTGGHVPPGTRKWTQMEHRLCSSSSQHWRGQPLVRYAGILSRRAATTPRTGLTVESGRDPHHAPAGGTITAAQLATIRMERAAFHGDWTSTIRPHAA
jgi:Rhodopirellula transposase DDE domain